jgi:hypothetical protein
MLPDINNKSKNKKHNTTSIDIDDAGTHIFTTPLSNSVSATFADSTPPSIRHRQTRPIVLDKSSAISPKLTFPFLQGSSSSRTTENAGTKKEYVTSMARLRPRPSLHVEENNNGNQEFHHVSHNPAGPISFIDRGDCHQRQDQINLERPVTVEMHDRDTTTSSCSCFDFKISRRSLWTPSIFSAFERKRESATAKNDET